MEYNLLDDKNKTKQKEKYINKRREQLVFDFKLLCSNGRCMWVKLSVNNYILYLLYMIWKCQVPIDLHMSSR